MIRRNSNFEHELTCDICGKGERFDYFDYVLDCKRDLGWKSEKYKGEWQDVCPECQEEGRMINIEKAIETLKDMKGVFDTRGHKQYSLSALDLAISTLEKQLTNGWIPVSERLPEKNDVYLVTFLEEGKRYVERFYYSDFVGWMMPVAWQDEGRIENIIAWQPLPEPWKRII